MIDWLKNRLNRIQVNIRRFGFLKTLIYLFNNIFVKRPVNQINYYLKRKKYSQNIIFITASTQKWFNMVIKYVCRFGWI